LLSAQYGTDCFLFVAEAEKQLWLTAYLNASVFVHCGTCPETPFNGAAGEVRQMATIFQQSAAEKAAS
jgi:hypothetical protein